METNKYERWLILDVRKDSPKGNRYKEILVPASNIDFIGCSRRGIMTEEEADVVLKSGVIIETIISYRDLLKTLQTIEK